MLRSFLSKISSFFYVHPDVAAKSQIELPKGKSFFDFMFRDHTGIALIIFMTGALMSFAFGVVSELIIYEALGGICTWLLIRAIGMHHGNWRRSALEESLGGTYRLGYDEALRHGNIPHYARIASVVLIVMVSVVGIRISWRYYQLETNHIVESRCAEHRMFPGQSRDCITEDGYSGFQHCDVASGQISSCTSIGTSDPIVRDAEPPSAGTHDARIGESCTTGIGGSGIYTLDGDMVICRALGETSANDMCRDVRLTQPHSDGTISVAYDLDAINTTFGECSTGWELVIWDQNGCAVGSDPGVVELTLDHAVVSGGAYRTGLRCGLEYRPWPNPSASVPVGVRSFIVNGHELVHNSFAARGMGGPLPTYPVIDSDPD